MTAVCVCSLLAQNGKLIRHLLSDFIVVNTGILRFSIHWSFVIMASFIAAGGIQLCQNLIKASVEQESVEDQFNQSAAQSGG